MVFDPLGMNLYEYLKMNGYKGFHIDDIRSITIDIVRSLEYLHSIIIETMCSGLVDVHLILRYDIWPLGAARQLR